MRHTPRQMRSPRGIGTLIGNGWLRESPREVWREQNKWEVRSKSSLRKCMFMPVPDEIRRLAPQVSQAALPHPPAARVSRPEPEPEAHRRDPRKDARQFPAYVPGGVIDPHLAAQQAHALHVHHAHKEAQKRAADAAKGAPPLAWWEDPVALGSLLILVPPVGLAAVWSSKRYSSDARWALTVMTALTMCLMSAIVIAVIAMR
ncbi:MAG: hypothetical protein JWP87_2124 [Labilithrix sp.]|nr:hypothetical protein [Labilithrix sp.]